MALESSPRMSGFLPKAEVANRGLELPLLAEGVEEVLLIFAIRRDSLEFLILQGDYGDDG